MEKKETKVWKIYDAQKKASVAAIKEVADRLIKGEVIAFPTETVYGLGANALDNKAVEKIFIAKGRPSDNPLIVHIANIEQLSELTDEVNEASQLLINEFWPGPLTIVFKKKDGISDLVTAGLNTVAVRMPNHPIALAILREVGIPIAAPSANRSGKPSPTSAEHVLNDLDGRIEGIVDSGASGVGIESTVIDVSGDIPLILRPGGVTIEELRATVGEVEIDNEKENNNHPRSPGMKYKHYAPKGQLIIIKEKEDKVINKINQQIIDQIKLGKSVGVLTLEGHKDKFANADLVLAYGKKDNLYPLAEHLYDALRQFDINDINYIIVEGVEEKGIGYTIMNRLSKAIDKKS